MRSQILVRVSCIEKWTGYRVNQKKRGQELKGNQKEKENNFIDKIWSSNIEKKNGIKL